MRLSPIGMMFGALQDYMVHYDPALMVIHHPPQICPKCGSHRTQVVGLSDGGQTIVIRCNACGERSEVSVERETADLTSDSRPPLSL